MNGSLSCNAQNCLYNANGLCGASVIKIRGGNAESSAFTQCDSFAEKGLKNSLANMFNMNIQGEIKQAFTNTSIEMYPKIECDARNCVYNIGNVCSADYIQINGQTALSSTRTECSTFKK
ncbi:DUF1540 domain-containing protein [Clostridium senegalense]|uniref:DUF1540 domain-containing protein n=1 Tax=Clostridium senegalense TaxID=1465809 RepID=UPI0002883E92|nr:DUF1540 domain-containing protein [Clostridium senegalense]MBU5226394.1 DUF1540 domain-containing protein [Clostridium senegalense]